MPKERKERSFDRSKLSPFPCTSSSPKRDDANTKEWEDARCPVCMEHPHNAILLICSSHEKGCRPFMCDTSYRHSNCFDQFKKSFGEPSTVAQISQNVTNTTSSPLPESIVSDLEIESIPESPLSIHDEPCLNPDKPILICPLCRGLINGWTIMESARLFMNGKSRSCASETCDFNGTYTDLRKHARLVHPLVRPTDADPERQRSWRRLERQRDIGDLFSTLQSSIGEEGTEEETLTIDQGSWMTVFFLVRFVQPRNNASGRSSGTTRARAQVTVRRRRRSSRLWGETTEGVVESRDDENEGSDGGEVSREFVRRRLHEQDEE